MKIIIEQDKCIGCGSCTTLCPSCFELGSDGKAILKQSAVPTKNQLEISAVDCANEAADCCPAQCIQIS